MRPITSARPSASHALPVNFPRPFTKSMLPSRHVRPAKGPQRINSIVTSWVTSEDMLSHLCGFCLSQLSWVGRRAFWPGDEGGNQPRERGFVGGRGSRRPFHRPRRTVCAIHHTDSGDGHAIVAQVYIQLRAERQSSLISHRHIIISSCRQDSYSVGEPLSPCHVIVPDAIAYSSG